MVGGLGLGETTVQSGGVGAGRGLVGEVGRLTASSSMDSAQSGGPCLVR